MAVNNKRPFTACAAGFTLAEVLAALMFMAIVVPVAVEALRVASLAGEISERKAEAARLADKALNEAIATAGAGQPLQGRTISQNGHQFSWTLHEGAWTDPSMELLTAGAWGERTGEMTALVDIRGCRSENFIVNGRDSKPTVTFVDVEAIRRDGALEDAYTRIDEAGQLPTVVKALARSMPGLADLRILKVNGDFVLHTFFVTGHPVPAFLAGDGFKRFLELAAAVVNLRKGVVLLEEPESFQHPRYLRELATLLFASAREGKQVILSTHSIELIDRILQAPEAEGLPYPAVHRLSLYDGSLRATTLDHEHALRMREDLLQDLRA